MTGTVPGADAEPDALSSEGLYEAVGAALRHLGIEHVADAVLQTFTLTDRSPAVHCLVAMSTTSVVFYVVRDEVVPKTDRAAVAELAARRNSDLHTSAVEVGVDSGTVAVRCGVALRGIWPELPKPALAGLLAAAIGEVRRAAAELAPALDRVLAGGNPAVR